MKYLFIFVVAIAACVILIFGLSGHFEAWGEIPLRDAKINDALSLVFAQVFLTWLFRGNYKCGDKK